ncbi:MAG: hypothetical protein Kilf2KO_10210 [Rhodospirillales bacterium]
MERITVEIRQVVAFGQQTQFGHLYLVYRNETGEETMISGEPTNGELWNYGPLITKQGVPVTARERDADGNPSAEVAGMATLDLDGVDPAAAWSVLLQHAANIEAAGLPYDLFTQNSNSTVASLLHAIGLDVEAALPSSVFDPIGRENLLVFDDSLIGSDGEDRLKGVAGDDSLLGAGGSDRLVGNSGQDRLYGGGGRDSFFYGGSGADRIFGGAGLERQLQGNAGDDLIFGGGGDDGLFGGDDRDSLYGDAGSDRLRGGSGDDLLDGGSGADLMIGGSGADLFYVDHQDDLVREEAGGAGRDQVIASVNDYTLAEGVEILSNAKDGLARTLTSSSGGASLVGNSASDLLRGQGGADTLFGGLGDDVLKGLAGDDDLRGRTGADTMIGGQGDDRLDGQGDQDRDLLFGGLDKDTLLLGNGDTASGGQGDDLFVFNGDESGAPLADGTLVARVVISDFQGALFGSSSGQDSLVFVPGLKTAAFSYIESAAFDQDGNSQARFNADLGQVEVDWNGDGDADIVFRLQGQNKASQITASDFVWLV